MIIVFLGARWLTESEFGSLALAIGLVTMCVGLSRAFVVQPFLISPQSGFDEHTPPTAAIILGAGLTLPLAVAALLLPLPRQVTLMMLVAAIAVPFLLGFEARRVIAIGCRRPQHSLTLDSIWLACFVLLVAAMSTASVRAVHILAAWFVPPTMIVVGLSVFSRGRSSLNLRDGAAYARFAAPLGSRLGLDYLLGIGAQQVTAVALAATVSLADLGAFRLALSWYGPVGVFFAGLSPLLLAETSRRRNRQGTESTAILIGFSFLLALAAAIFMIASLTLPGVSAALLGESASERLTPMILPIGFFFIGSAATAGAGVGLTAAGNVNALLRLRWMGSPLTIVLPLVGGHLRGATGAGWGLAIASPALASMTWIAFIRASRRAAP